MIAWQGDGEVSESRRKLAVDVVIGCSFSERQAQETREATVGRSGDLVRQSRVTDGSKKGKDNVTKLEHTESSAVGETLLTLDSEVAA